MAFYSEQLLPLYEAQTEKGIRYNLHFDLNIMSCAAVAL